MFDLGLSQGGAEEGEEAGEGALRRYRIAGAGNGADMIRPDVMQAFVDAFAEAGFDITLRPTEFAALQSALKAGDFEVGQSGWSGRVDPDGNIHQYVTCEGSLNDAKYCNEEVDRLLNEARQTPDTQARIPLYEEAQAILGALGKELYVDEEGYLDMATALSGTGPAYVFLFMEALIAAGVHMGFSRRIAQELVYQTIEGAVAIARASGAHPTELRNQVTSPGGTTAEALYQLEKGGFRTVISKAIWAAYQRSRALGEMGEK